VAEEISDVIDAVVYHSWALEGKTPGNNTNILGKTHRTEHFWSEDTGVSDFDPTLKLRVETKDLERGLSVGVVSRLELHLLNANLGVEFLHDTKKVAQANISVSDETLNLMELSKMSSIKSLVSKDTINREVFHWLETFS